MSFIMFMEYGSDRVYWWLSWLTDDQFYMAGLGAGFIALIAFIPAVWVGALMAITASITYVKDGIR